MELQWFYEGNQHDIPNGRKLLSFLSNICDKVYSAAPNLRNELVNRRNLSSAAAGARMRLIERIFRYESRPLLDMDPNKKPPEMSIYLSLLKRAGLHQEVNGRWAITEPGKGDSDTCKVQPVLDRIRSILEGKQERRVKIGDIYEELRRWPFGVREGIIPVLIAAFAKANEQDIAFYENGTFMRQVEGSDFQRIIKDPDSFELQYCRITGVRSELFDRIMDVLGLERRVSNKTEILDVVQPLCQFAARLPAYAHGTRRLSKISVAVRSALLSAKEPASLLFNDLPEACGVGAILPDANVATETVQRFVARLKASIDDLRDAYPALHERMKSHIATTCDLPGTFQDIRRMLSEVSGKILVAVTEPKLKAFCMRLMDDDLPESQWLESLGSFVCSKPPSRWLDVDEGMFCSELDSLVTRFRRVESICFDSDAFSNRGNALRVAITRADGAEIERVVYVAASEEGVAEEMEAEIAKILRKNRRIGMTAISRAFWKAISQHGSD